MISWRSPSCLSIFLLCTLWGICLSAPQKLLPVDEAAKSPSFLSFRGKLQDVVSRQDAGGLMAVVDPEITYAFYSPFEPGVAGFRKHWKLDQPRSAIWTELGRVLRRGGAFASDGMFIAPYVWSNWPTKGGSPDPDLSDEESDDNGVITGARVSIRKAPNAQSPVLTRLSYDLVKLAETKSSGDWVQIKLPGGGLGYVHTDYLARPLGYRAFFSKKSGQWRMVTLINGQGCVR